MQSRSDITPEDISIIIPTLNEAQNIRALLVYLQTTFPDCEVIVVDGSSRDETASVAAEFARTEVTAPGRGLQMNRGAQLARGRVLWFVHADCRPHRLSVKAMVRLLNDGDFAGGGFQYGFADGDWRFRFMARYSNLKNRVKRQVFGDMGIFVHRETFRQLGGYRQELLMEDFDFGRRLRRFGKVAILPLRMQTSPRDWHTRGILRKIVKDTFVRFAFLLNTNEQTLYRWYYGNRHKPER